MKGNNNKYMKKFAVKKGFTLIELLIGIVLFTIFLGIVSQSYLGIIRAQRHANDVRKMYSEVRYFVDVLSEDIRLGVIDYDCYSLDFNLNSLCDADSKGIISSGKSNVLSLIKKDGLEKVTYKFESQNIKIKRWYKDYDTQSWVEYDDEFLSLFSGNILIKKCDFAIFPSVNPYDIENYNNNSVQFQPKITLFLTVLDEEKSINEFDFQTTISSRVYTRSI